MRYCPWDAWICAPHEGHVIARTPSGSVIIPSSRAPAAGSCPDSQGILFSSARPYGKLKRDARLAVSRCPPSRAAVANQEFSRLVYMKFEKSQLDGREVPERDRMICVAIHPSPGNRGQEGLRRRRSMFVRWGCLCGSHGKQQEATGRGRATASTAKRPREFSPLLGTLRLEPNLRSSRPRRMLGSGRRIAGR